MATSSTEESRSFKVIMLGDVDVGKTSLFRRFMNESFPRSTNTILATRDRYAREFKFGDKIVEIYLWDTAGMERMFSLTETYFRESAAAILVFDPSNPVSFHNIQVTWIPALKRRYPDAQKFLVMNKTDIIQSGKGSDGETVTVEDAQQYMKESEHDFAKLFQVSAKTTDGVEGMYNDIAAVLGGLSSSNFVEKGSTLKLEFENQEEQEKRRFRLFDWIRTRCSIL